MRNLLKSYAGRLAALAIAAAALPSDRAIAEAFPDKAVELINPASPGGGTDIFLRMLTAASADKFPGSFNVVSKSGGRGVVAMSYVAGEPRDGYTLMTMTPSMLLQVAQGKVPYTMEDIVPIVVGTVDPLVLVAKPGRFADGQDMVDQGRAGALVTGGTMAGSLEWMGLQAFVLGADLEKPRYLPTKGGAEVLQNVIGGNVDVRIGNITEIADLVKAGEIQALVVLADQRSDALPDIPTAKDLGIDVSMSQARGLIALRGTPQDRVDMLEKTFLEGMQAPAYQEYLANSGLGQDSIGDSKTWGAMIEDITRRMVTLSAQIEAGQ